MKKTLNYKHLAIRLKDKSVILGKIAVEDELAGTSSAITIFDPLNLVQLINPMNGQPEVSLMPMDIIFADAKEDQNFVEIPNDFVVWKKDLDAFPNYKESYIQATTKIETPSKKIIH